MVSYLLKLVVILVVCSVINPALGADEDSVTRPITSYTLGNGLKILLYPEASQPTFTVNVVYKTGAKHEGSGEYGMAHLLEHMAFQNTKNFRDIPRELVRRGARFNANTNADRTTYYETLPASLENLEFALALEAERMSQVYFTEEALQKEKSAVQQEFDSSGRSGFQPLLQAMLELAYPHHPYGRDTFGLDAGLLKVSLEQVQTFYQRRYDPGLAVLSVGGDFSLADAKRLIDKYFAPLPHRNKNLEQPTVGLKPQFSERLVVIPKPGGPSYVGVLYRAMPGADRSYVAAQALVHCLSSHPESLLQKKLIRMGFAREAFGFVQQSVDEGFIAFVAKPGPGRDPVQLVQRLARLVEGAQASCSAKDLQRFQVENSAAWADLMRNTRALTMQLGEFEVQGNWRLFEAEPLRSEELRLDDLTKVASWLTPHNRCSGVLDPKGRHSLAEGQLRIESK